MFTLPAPVLSVHSLSPARRKQIGSQHSGVVLSNHVFPYSTCSTLKSPHKVAGLLHVEIDEPLLRGNSIIIITGVVLTHFKGHCFQNSQAEYHIRGDDASPQAHIGLQGKDSSCHNHSLKVPENQKTLPPPPLSELGFLWDAGLEMSLMRRLFHSSANYGTLSIASHMFPFKMLGRKKT